MRMTAIVLCFLALAGAGLAETTEAYNYNFNINGSVLYGRTHSPCVAPVEGAEITFGVFRVFFWGAISDLPLAVFTGPPTDEDGLWSRYCAFNSNIPNLNYVIYHYNPINQMRGQMAYHPWNEPNSPHELDICMRDHSDIYPDNPTEGEKAAGLQEESMTWSTIKGLYR